MQQLLFFTKISNNKSAAAISFLLITLLLKSEQALTNITASTGSVHWGSYLTKPLMNIM